MLYHHNHGHHDHNSHDPHDDFRACVTPARPENRTSLPEAPRRNTGLPRCYKSNGAGEHGDVNQ